MERMRNLVLSSALLLAACSKTEPSAEKTPSAPTPATTESAARTADPSAGGDPHGGGPHAGAGTDPHGGSNAGTDPHGGLPPGHPPMGGGAAGSAAAGSGDAGAVPLAPPTAGGLAWTAPAPLEQRPPKSQMRVAEYGLAGAPQLELAVFYFGADQGGTVDANMTRWVGQLTQPDGKETKAKRSERKVKSIDVSLVEAKGTYSGGMMMPGAGASAEQPDSMLLGAIARGPQGSVFFKMVGPRADVEKARKAFDGLINSLHPSDAAAK